VEPSKGKTLNFKGKGGKGGEKLAARQKPGLPMAGPFFLLKRHPVRSLVRDMVQRNKVGEGSDGGTPWERQEEGRATKKKDEGGCFERLAQGGWSIRTSNQWGSREGEKEASGPKKGEGIGLPELHLHFRDSNFL